MKDPDAVRQRNSTESLEERPISGRTRKAALWGECTGDGSELPVSNRKT